MKNYFDINNIDADKKYNIILGQRCNSIPSEGLTIKLQHAIRNLFKYYVDGNEVSEEEFLQHLKGVTNGKSTTR